MSRFDTHRFRQDLVMVVDLDERGWFKAHVENSNGRIVFQCSNEGPGGWPDPEGFWMVENGFLRHGRDVDGMLNYLQHLGIAGDHATLRLEG